MEKTTKICTKCLLEQSIDNFGIARHTKDGRFYVCKTCRHAQNMLPEQRERQKFANEKHRNTEGYKQKAPLHRRKYYKNGGKENQKKYVAEHQDKLKPYHKKYSKAWSNTPEGQASLKKARMKFHNKNVEASRARYREQYYIRKQSIEYRVNDAISSSIYDALKERKNGRRWEKIVGYTLSDLMQHIEKQFADGMSWDNYGQWHIDHIKPRYTFTIDQIKECWMLSNLRPLWAEDNLKRPKPRLALPL